MAACFPSKVKNPCVHLIVCFGPFLGADPHGLIMLLSLFIGLRGPEVEICLCFLVVLCWLVGSRGRFRFSCVREVPGEVCRSRRREETMEYFYVMGRVTRGRGGRYPKGKVVRRQKEVARQPEDRSRVIQRQGKFHFKGESKISRDRSQK